MSHRRYRTSKWTLDACMEDAAKYTQRTEWNRLSKGAANAARREGWFEACVRHMEPTGPVWDFDECQRDAKKYKTRTKWRENSYGYTVARKNNWLDECCRHMSARSLYWDLDACLVEAKRYKSYTQWRIQSPTSYQRAQEKHWLESCKACFSNPDEREPFDLSFEQIWRFPFPSAYDSLKARERLRKYRHLLGGFRVLHDNKLLWQVWEGQQRAMNLSLTIKHVLNGEAILSLANEHGCSRDYVRRSIAQTCKLVDNLSRQVVSHNTDVQPYSYISNSKIAKLQLFASELLSTSTTDGPLMT